MAIIHNCIIRGANAIYLQTPFVHTEQDITDFLFFVRAWASWLTLHHRLEDEGLFDDFERVAQKPGCLAVNHRQHQEFEGGIERLLAMSNKPPAEYDAQAIRALLDEFGPAMHRHLTDEIDTLLELRPYDHDALMEVYNKAQASLQTADAATKAMTLPLTLGLHDVTYDDAGRWPPMPDQALEGLVKAFGHQHAGAWRFLPCSSRGEPRPLAFVS